MRYLIYTGELRLVRENIHSILISAGCVDVVCFFLWNDISKSDIDFISNKLLNSAFYYFRTPLINSSKVLTLEENIIVDKWIYQYYLIHKAFTILKDKGINEHDLIIRSRTDLFVENEFSLNFDNSDVVVPGFKYGIGVTDYFAVNTFKGFHAYSKTFQKLLWFKKQGILLPPEVVLGLSLHDHMIKVTANPEFPRLLLGLNNRKLYFRTSLINENSIRYLTFTNSNFILNKKANNFLSEFMSRIYYSTLGKLVYIRLRFILKCRQN